MTSSQASMTSGEAMSFGFSCVSLICLCCLLKVQKRFHYWVSALESWHETQNNNISYVPQYLHNIWWYKIFTRHFLPGTDLLYIQCAQFKENTSQIYIFCITPLSCENHGCPKWTIFTAWEQSCVISNTKGFTTQRLLLWEIKTSETFLNLYRNTSNCFVTEN